MSFTFKYGAALFKLRVRLFMKLPALCADYGAYIHAVFSFLCSEFLFCLDVSTKGVNGTSVLFTIFIPNPYQITDSTSCFMSHDIHLLCELVVSSFISLYLDFKQGLVQRQYR